MDKRHSDSPLSVAIEGEELVIRIGIDRLDGHDRHPELPELKFEDKHLWVKDVIREIERDEEDGSCPISDLLDKAMIEAIEQGSAGITEDSATHVGICDVCKEPFRALSHQGTEEVCAYGCDQIEQHSTTTNTKMEGL